MEVQKQYLKLKAEADQFEKAINYLNENYCKKDNK